MQLEQYRTIEAGLNLANDYTPPIRLNAGDLNGRILRFHVTDGGTEVTDPDSLTARLTWNRDPEDPNSGGGYAQMDPDMDPEEFGGPRRAVFTTPVPRALLLQAGERTVLGVDIHDTDGNVIVSRSIPVIVEPSRLNPSAPELADPLQDLHDTIDQAQQLIDTADLTMGEVTTLNPNQPATGSLTGSGWRRELHLAIPRGSTISRMTATALDSETPTVTTGSDENGDITVALGLPRGKQGIQGEKGEKGEPGDVTGIGIATRDKAGLVKSSDEISVISDGTMHLRDTGRWFSQNGLFAEPFGIGTVMLYKGMGVFYDPLIAFTPNPLFSRPQVSGPVEIQVLGDRYQFTNDSDSVSFMTPMLPSSPERLANGLEWIGVKVTPVTLTNKISIEFFREASGTAAYNLTMESTGNLQKLRSPTFICQTTDAREMT